MTSLTFRNSRGVQHILSRRGGGGVKLFFQGDGVQLLSDRSFDLYWTSVPALDPRYYHEFSSTTGSFIMHSPRCMFYSNLNV